MIYVNFASASRVAQRRAVTRLNLILEGLPWIPIAAAIVVLVGACVYQTIVATGKSQQIRLLAVKSSELDREKAVAERQARRANLYAKLDEQMLACTDSGRVTAAQTIAITDALPRSTFVSSIDFNNGSWAVEARSNSLSSVAPTLIALDIAGLTPQISTLEAARPDDVSYKVTLTRRPPGANP